MRNGCLPEEWILHGGLLQADKAEACVPCCHLPSGSSQKGIWLERRKGIGWEVSCVQSWPTWESVFSEHVPISITLCESFKSSLWQRLKWGDHKASSNVVQARNDSVCPTRQQQKCWVLGLYLKGELTRLADILDVRSKMTLKFLAWATGRM